MRKSILALALILSSLAGTLLAGPGIKVAVGTDTKGAAFGVGFTYLAPSQGSTSLELGSDLFFHSSKDEGTSDDHYDWKEETKLTLLLFKVNAVFGQKPNASSVYFVAGSGFVVGSVDWQETGKGTAGYTYLSPYTKDFEGTAFGSVFNLGLGFAGKSGLEFRAETPLLVFYGDYGTAAFVPTITATLIYRFGSK